MQTKPKILIVDDRPENLVALQRVLKDLNVELIKATSGNEALKATLHHNFMLAILDVQMPEMDGYELASILREEEKTSYLPFIFISAVYTDNINIFKGYEQGAFSFIAKPFQPEILINKVKFFIEKYQHEIELLQLNKDLKNTNEELKYANKELDSFSYSVSHDLRAPLRAISGYSQILMEDYGNSIDEDGKAVINTIIRNASKMGCLIDDLLTFSRVGKQNLTKVPLNMKNIVENIIEEFQELSKNNIPEFEIEELPNTEGDNSMLKQVFTNLISNAIKYSGKKEKAKVQIGSYTDNDRLVYYVKDNGSGFDMKYYDKLFGVFQRLHSSAEFEGTGVGLALVQRIVRKHHGEVWAEAKLDEGATFFFSLPNTSNELN